MKLWYWILDLLFPPKCALCRRILEQTETDFCANCRKDSPLFPELPGNMHPSGKSRLQFLDSFTAVWYYKGNVRSGILRLKFHGAAALAAPYGRMLAMKLYQCRRESFDLITWVPVSTKRRRKRGYDQAELLARSVGAELGYKPVCLLKKLRDNPAQSGLRGEQRRANVLGVYGFTGKTDLHGKRILLIDDVFTTGATAEECARVLKTAGASSVHCGAVAAAQKEE